MPTPDFDRLRAIKSFPSLVKYLRDELDWPIDTDDVDELTFDYSAEERGWTRSTELTNGKSTPTPRNQIFR